MRTMTADERAEIQELAGTYENNRPHNEEVLLRYCELLGIASVVGELPKHVRSSFLEYMRYIVQFEGPPPSWYRPLPVAFRRSAIEFLEVADA
jgi:hypothetical protein